MSRSDRLLVAACGSAVVLAIAAATILVMPPPEAGTTDEAATLLASNPMGLGESPLATAETDVPQEIVVDVQGAVLGPGIRSLPSGSRVGDALAAAGGYAPDADLEATARSINLAQSLEDGQQIIVPALGATAAATGPPVPADGGSAPAAGGLVDLNTASAGELEALPGIGEVTVEKIMAARAERPFSSLEDAVQRGVIHNGQLEDIRGLATAS